MAHLVETMAYSKAEVPWHGLGVPVEADLTPLQIMKKAGLDWSVKKIPGYYSINGQEKPLGWSALVRDKDHTQLTTIPDDWNEVQNLEAFEFFNAWIAEGSMAMETAGALRGGQMVWALARLKESFDLFGGKDVVNGYFLFTLPHRYGWSTSVSLTSIRVVCNNTLTASLNNTAKDKILRVNHSRKFDGDEVKETIGVAKDKLAKYKEIATFLSKKRAANENVVEYFQRIFPVSPNAQKKLESLGSKKCLEILHTQPGADIAKDSWWNAYNAVTYFTDHIQGRTPDTRLSSAWYGVNRGRKIRALELATEYAEAA